MRKPPEREKVSAHVVGREVHLYKGRQTGRQGSFLTSLPVAESLRMWAGQRPGGQFGVTQLCVFVDLGKGEKTISHQPDKRPMVWVIDHVLSMTIFEGVRFKKRDPVFYKDCREALLGVWSGSRAWRRLEEEIAELELATSVLEA